MPRGGVKTPPYELLEKGVICAGEAREKSLPIRGGGREAGRKGSAR